MPVKLSNGFELSAGQILITAENLNEDFPPNSVIFILYAEDDECMGLNIAHAVSEKQESLFTIHQDIIAPEALIDSRIVWSGPHWDGEFTGPENGIAQSILTPNESIADGVDFINAEMKVAIPHGSLKEGIFCLGITKWEAGELESQIHAGHWNIIPYDRALLFNTPIEDRFAQAARKETLYPSMAMEI